MTGHDFCDRPRISFVIPARNEEALLGRTLQYLRRSAEEVGHPYEIIVVDDGSIDRTATIARSHQVQVVSVELHNIAAVRNAGARTARGDVLFFLDADTLLPAATLRGALRAIDRGAVGGGASVRFEGPLNLCLNYLALLFALYWQRIGGWAAGCSIFVRREVFDRVGGFNPQFFAAEERELSRALQRQGRFVILWEPVITSARKLRIFSPWSILKLGISALVLQPGQLQQRQGLEYLYDAPRESAG